jgi:hypothetical protein
MSIRRDHFRRFPPRITPVAVLVLGLLVGPAVGRVWAAGNPVGCSDPTVNIDIQEFRDVDNNGTLTFPPDVQLLPFEEKVPGEHILYRAVLSHSGAVRCGFEQGRVCIDLPQLGCGAMPTFDPPSFTTVGAGECCAADIANAVPLVCDPLTCNPAGTAKYFSNAIPYVVNPTDADNQILCPPGHLRANAYYDVGLSKQGSAIDPDVIPANASIPICNKVKIEVRHFMCYEGTKIQVGRSVTLEDRFRTVTANVGNFKRICNPADKNGEDPGALNFPDHLASYEIDAPSFTNVDAEVTNQFGTQIIELLRPVRLLVPTAKGDLGPPPLPPTGPPNPPVIDHFNCYAAKGPAVNKTVMIEDQFGILQVKARQPDYVCVPVNKNSGGFVNPNGAFGFGLACYDVDTTPDRQDFKGMFYIDNQFTAGAEEHQIHGPRELCLQSSIVIP